MASDTHVSAPDTRTDEITAIERSPGDTKSLAIARLIDARFSDYRRAFSAITLTAGARFAHADWQGSQAASLQRLGLYNTHVHAASEAVRALSGNYPAPGLWHRVKLAYIRLLAERFDYELAETFFNSVHRRVMHAAYVREDEMFVLSPFTAPPKTLTVEVFKRWTAGDNETVLALVRRVLTDQRFTLPWENLDRDATRIAAALHNILRGQPHGLDIEHATGEAAFEFVRMPFYRNKGAYLVGRFVWGALALPVTIPALHNEPVLHGPPALHSMPVLQKEGAALFVDTLLAGEDELSIVFSFTRAYFMVDTALPSALVSFLKELMPQKQPSELYAALGLRKHGKTEFYRSFVEHLSRSSDQFIIAPGIKGMVMAVFTLPSYRTVFKIIKDRFAPQKNTTRAQVKAAYRLVKEHDRVGRMADTQEFQNMVFPRGRFAPELIAELLETCRGSVQIVGDRIVIAHLYTERAMTPLNLYLQTASDSEIRQALDGYGRAIKELAAANIFAGDMLLKNFGVTRHGRVVFYDYDEICYLTEVNFRRIPAARTEEDALSAEPWYSVAPGDVFPEEFEQFLFGRASIRQLFRQLHGELYDADYWRGLQAKIRTGELLDVFPYPADKRFEDRSTR